MFLSASFSNWNDATLTEEDTDSILDVNVNVYVGIDLIIFTCQLS